MPRAAASARAGLASSGRQRYNRSLKRITWLLLWALSSCSHQPARQDEVFRLLISVRDQYPAQIALWSREPLRSYLKELLGTSYQTFLDDMEVACPVTEEHGVLFVTGNRLREGAGAGAVLLADPAHRSLRVSLWDGSRWVHSSNGGSEIHPPPEAHKFYQRYLGIDTHAH